MEEEEAQLMREPSRLTHSVTRNRGMALDNMIPPSSRDQGLLATKEVSDESPSIPFPRILTTFKLPKQCRAQFISPCQSPHPGYIRRATSSSGDCEQCRRA